MTDLRAAAQQALEALEGELPGWRTPAQENAITALRAALAQQEQEPVAWRYQNSNTEREYLVWNKGTGGRNWTPLYTHPPRRETEQEPVAWCTLEELAYLKRVIPSDSRIPLYTKPPRREWQGLTEEEIDAVLFPYCDNKYEWIDYREVACAVEQALKEKNQ